MATRARREEQFIHLVRLSWDLATLGMATSLVLPPDGPPVLDIMRTMGRPFRVQVIRRSHGWVFSWRPSWSRFWRQGEWVWALDEHAATKIKAAVTA